MKNYIILFAILYLCHIDTLSQIITQSNAEYSVLIHDSVYDNHICKYTLCNNEYTEKMIVLFTEDNVAEYDHTQLIKRKIFRNYGDFRLSMIEWDNIDSENLCAFVPELFIKVLNPKDSFDIFICSNDSNNIDISKHILTCSESDLSEIGLQHFVYYINLFHFEYAYSYIVINDVDFRSFLMQNKT